MWHFRFVCHFALLQISPRKFETVKSLKSNLWIDDIWRCHALAYLIHSDHSPFCDLNFSNCVPPISIVTSVSQSADIFFGYAIWVVHAKGLGCWNPEVHTYIAKFSSVSYVIAELLSHTLFECNLFLFWPWLVSIEFS